jgi:hypothetical protein
MSMIYETPWRHRFAFVPVRVWALRHGKRCTSKEWNDQRLGN